MWEKELMGVVINDNLRYASIEIDENKIISSDNEIFWILGLIDRNKKEARVKCVLTDGNKNKLLPIVKNNVNANDDSDQIIDANFSIKTHIFLDCFNSYQPGDFLNMGYFLKRVN